MTIRKNRRQLKRSMRKRNGLRRRGAAVIELAACLPVLMIVTLAFIDLTNLTYFRQTLKIAAYDAARTAARPGATTTEINAAAQRLLDDRNVVGWELSIPDDYADIDRGEQIDLSLSAPLTEVAFFTRMKFWDTTDDLVVNLAIVKE